MNLRDETLLITGASRGIGRRLALHFATRSAMTLLLARDRQRLQELQNDITGCGGRCRTFAIDLRDSSAINALHEELAAHPVDGLINNAADTTSKPFGETSLAEMDSVIRTNLIGPLQLTRLVVPSMQARGRGVIINMSSLAGFNPNPNQTVYSVSKTAVNAMSDALRKELRPSGIRVVNLALPSVAIDGVPSAGQIPVQRVADAVEQALARGSRDIFFSPVSRWLMRLYRAFPTLADVRP